ncbi:MAG TPA: hypothetical protein VNC16_02235 [Solirubrobacterales bacterium]|nr:hypothetical protein [Solirubrobacterales bacterium]
MDWNALNRLPPEEGAEALTELAGHMSDLVSANPEIEVKLMDVLERNLGSSVDTDTYTPVWYGIAALFGIGDDAPRLFAWLSAPDQPERLDAIVGHCGGDLARLLRSVVALHGQSLQDAYRRWREYPGNWEAMYRQVYVDSERNQTRIDIKIVTYDEQRLDLTLDARSLLLMISRLMNSLTLAASGPFAESELNELRDQSGAFWEAVSAAEDSQAQVAEGEPTPT